MKESLIILFLVIALVCTAKAQDGCIRVVTHAPVQFNVGWCSVPVEVNIPNGIGYCTNARCKSVHRTHPIPEEVVQGK